MINNDKEMIKKKLSYYYKKQVEVHIKLKSGEFRNGFLIELETPEVYVMKERFFGLIHIWIEEVTKIEEFRSINK